MQSEELDTISFDALTVSNIVLDAELKRKEEAVERFFDESKDWKEKVLSLAKKEERFLKINLSSALIFNKSNCFKLIFGSDNYTADLGGLLGFCQVASFIVGGCLCSDHDVGVGLSIIILSLLSIIIFSSIFKKVVFDEVVKEFIDDLNCKGFKVYWKSGEVIDGIAYYPAFDSTYEYQKDCLRIEW